MYAVVRESSVVLVAWCDRRCLAVLSLSVHVDLNETMCRLKHVDCERCDTLEQQFEDHHLPNPREPVPMHYSDPCPYPYSPLYSDLPLPYLSMPMDLNNENRWTPNTSMSLHMKMGPKAKWLTLELRGVTAAAEAAEAS